MACRLGRSTHTLIPLRLLVGNIRLVGDNTISRVFVHLPLPGPIILILAVILLFLGLSLLGLGWGSANTLLEYFRW